MKRLIICLILGSFSSLAFASARISIPVQQPIVSPQATSHVSLEALKQGVTYNVICIIESDHDDIQATMNISGLNYNPNLTVNGNVNNFQTQLPKGDNILEVLYFMNAEANIFIPELVISNMDNDGTLMIKQCFADPTQAGFTGAPVSQLPGSGQALN